MSDSTYLKRIYIIKIKIEDINGKGLNLSETKIVIIVPIQIIKIPISLNKKSLLIGGMEELINPYLQVRYNGLINAICGRNKMRVKKPNFLVFAPLLKNSNPVLTAKTNPR